MTAFAAGAGPPANRMATRLISGVISASVRGMAGVRGAAELHSAGGPECGELRAADLDSKSAEKPRQARAKGPTVARSGQSVLRGRCCPLLPDHGRRMGPQDRTGPKKNARLAAQQLTLHERRINPP